MVSRIVSFTVQLSRVNAFRNAINKECLPRIQALPGFVESIESLDPETGKFCCVTVWQTPEDEQRYANGVFQEVARAITPLLQDGPTIATLPVENSSVHHIEAAALA